ncbi:hypothetical protein Pmar_PMAR021847, partial [Perkinsus marinus ATCC 50983]
MSLSINAAPDCEDVVRMWSVSEPRRKKIPGPLATKRDRGGIAVGVVGLEEDFVYDDVVFEVKISTGVG